MENLWLPWKKSSVIKLKERVVHHLFKFMSTIMMFVNLKTFCLCKI